MDENPNDGKSNSGYEKHEKVIVAMEEVEQMTSITSSVLSSIVCIGLPGSAALTETCLTVPLSHPPTLYFTG